ncbi:unnamed protein product, partial [Mesorhabditis spiculigera]
MCRSFANFAAKWNPTPETLLSWSRDNCDKIQPRPADMSCADIVQFVSDCNYVAGTHPGSLEADRLTMQQARQQYYRDTNVPQELGKYTWYNRQTTIDYGRHGNWYYPNYYLPSFISGWYDGHPESVQQLRNDYRFSKGGNYPYMRADNVVNIALQQTSLPTCLHDLFYCLRAQYQSPYAQRYRKMKEEQWTRR